MSVLQVPENGPVQLDKDSKIELNHELVQALGGAERLAAWLEQSGCYKVLRRLDVAAMIERLSGCVLQDPLRVLVVDTETTGLDADACDLIELGMVLFEVDKSTGQMGRVLGQYGGLEQPSGPIPVESTAVHGITDEMVRGQCFDERCVFDLLAQATLCVAHNAVFDRNFLVRRFAAFADIPWACSLQELPWVKEGHAGRKLEHLLADMGVFYGAHRAVEDCFALAYVLSMPLRTSGCQPWSVLLDSAEQPIYHIAAFKAPFQKKDLLKARGFFWNKDDRVWQFQSVGFSQSKELIEWLRSQVYETTGQIELGFKVQSGVLRYANASDADWVWRMKGV